MNNQPNPPIFTPENEARALAEIERLERTLDITNVSHIQIWLDAWRDYAGSAYFACRIADAHEAGIAQARREALEEAVRTVIDNQYCDPWENVMAVLALIEKETK